MVATYLDTQHAHDVVACKTKARTAQEQRSAATHMDRACRQNATNVMMTTPMPAVLHLKELSDRS
jgi:hypothetical protein